MIVVRISVQLVNGHIDLVRPFDEIETLDREERFGIAKDAHRLQFLDAGVGPVATHAFGVEYPDPDNKIVFNYPPRLTITEIFLTSNSRDI